METTQTIGNHSKLSSVEIGSLWNSYILESMVHHAFSYFSNNVEDNDIKAYVDFCMIASRSHVNSIRSAFEEEKIPVPRGTTSEDVDVNAPRLFSDKFYMFYIKNMANFALLNYAMSYARASRNDIRQLFNEKLLRLREVDQVGTEIMIYKGIYIIPPSVEVPSQVDFVEKNTFFAGIFGSKRPLTVLEITQLFFNLESNLLGKALMLGFSQVAQSKEVHDYLIKGKELSAKYAEDFSEKLKEDNISIPPSLESEVLPISNSIPPFSDRFLLNQTVFLNSYGIGNYGMALSQSQRRDLSVMYGKIMSEVGLYADDGADLLTQNKWLEQPPLATDRKSLCHT